MGRPTLVRLESRSIFSGEPVDYDGPREADGIAEWLSFSHMNCLWNM